MTQKPNSALRGRKNGYWQIQTKQNPSYVSCDHIIKKYNNILYNTATTFISAVLAEIKINN